jgi:hypothetical protein
MFQLLVLTELRDFTTVLIYILTKKNLSDN